MTDVIIRLPKMETGIEKQVVNGIRNLAKAQIARAMMLKEMDMMLSGSNITEADAIEMGRTIKKGRYGRLKKAGLV